MRPETSFTEPWMDRAACLGYPTGMFFGEEGSRKGQPQTLNTQAKRVCYTCPVRRECLTYALEREGSTVGLGMAKYYQPERPGIPERMWDAEFRITFSPYYGIFGGTTVRERHARSIKDLPLDERVGLLLELLDSQRSLYIHQKEER